MSKLLTSIDALTEFGVNPAVKVEDKTEDKYVVLKRLLIDMYSEYLNAEDAYDEKTYDDPPDFDYTEIRTNIVPNFPDIGWYHALINSHNIIPEAELVTGDAVDDLADIIRDLLKVKWRMEHTSEADAMWHFRCSMKFHTEQHLVDLLKYLKDLEE